MTSKKVDELRKLDTVFQETCNDMSLEPGTLFRIASQYLGNWGVEVNHHNQEWIEQVAEQDYQHEWRGGTKGTNDAIEVATKRSGLIHGNSDLNLVLGKMAVDALVTMAKRHRNDLIVADVGAGAGDTTVAVLDNLIGSGLAGCSGRLHFYLMEPSIKRLAVAEERLEMHTVQTNRTLVAGTLQAHDPFLSDDVFDVIITNAVLHHMTTDKHLHGLLRLLRPGGLLIVGDWYTSIWSHPALFIDIMSSLRPNTPENRERRMQFQMTFGVNEGDRRKVEAQMLPSEVEANIHMRKYIVALADEARRLDLRSKPKILEGHEALRDRLAKMKAAGFEVDPEMLRRHKEFARISPVARLYRGSDIASVIAVKKPC